MESSKLGGTKGRGTVAQQLPPAQSMNQLIDLVLSAPNTSST